MPSPFSIRAAAPSELALLVDFQQRLAYETENGLQLSAATLTKGVQRLFDEPHRGVYWVVEAEGRVIACVLVMTEWSDWRNGEVFWIHSLYVEAAYRGQGVFRLIYTFFEQQVQNSPDLKGIRLFVEKQNEKAQRAYDAVGMSREHYELYEWLK